MACAVYRAEGQSASVVRLYESSDLVVELVGPPLLRNVPVQTVDPVFCAEGGNGAINVARVVQHLVSASEGLVNPLRALRVPFIAHVDSVSAEVPGLNTSWNVERCFDICSIQVVHDRISECAGWQHGEMVLTERLFRSL